MAIHDQCLKCKNFSDSLCSLTSANPEFNQRSCENYIKKGINLEKRISSNNPDSLNASVQSVTPINELTVDTSSRCAEEIRNSDRPPIPEKQRLFAHPFSFSGRIRRLEYFLSWIITLVYPYVSAFLLAPIVFGVGLSEDAYYVAYYMSLIPWIWFWFAQICKRFHDRGQSGMYVFLYFIPFVNIFVCLMQFFSEGDDFENDYGPDPKG